MKTEKEEAIEKLEAARAHFEQLKKDVPNKERELRKAECELERMGDEIRKFKQDTRHSHKYIGLKVSTWNPFAQSIGFKFLQENGAISNVTRKWRDFKLYTKIARFQNLHTITLK